MGYNTDENSKNYGKWEEDSVFEFTNISDEQAKINDLLEKMHQPKDLSLKFINNPNTGDVGLKTGSNAVRESIKNLIQTGKDERPFQPTLGSNIQNLLFEPNDLITMQLLEDEIRTVVENWEKRARVMDVGIESIRDGFEYKVVITFSVVNETEPVTFTTFLQRTRG